MGGKCSRTKKMEAYQSKPPFQLVVINSRKKTHFFACFLLFTDSTASITTD